MSTQPIKLHTPTPWGIEEAFDTLWIGPMHSDGVSVKVNEVVINLGMEGYNDEAVQRSRANAQFIVRSVNSHEALVAAARKFVAKVESGKAKSRESYAEFKVALALAEKDL